MANGFFSNPLGAAPPIPLGMEGIMPGIQQGAGPQQSFNTGDPLERFVLAATDPVERQRLIDEFSAQVLLPEELGDRSKVRDMLKGLFAEAALPPQPPRQAASTGGGPSLGQTNQGQNFLLQLFQGLGGPTQGGGGSPALGQLAAPRRR